MTVLPAWWEPLRSTAATVTARDLSAWVPPADGGRASAVLVLLGEGAEGIDVLLIQRSARLRAHAGQPAFPGGATDPEDDGPVGTAIREAAEETGLDPAGVHVVAVLPDLFVPPTRFVVTPVLGWWHTPSPVAPGDPAEVAEVRRIPIDVLADPANRVRVRHPSGYVGPGFEVDQWLVWGFTAGLLDRVLEMADWARPWDQSRVRDLPVVGA